MLDLPDGRRVSIVVDPRDEIDEVWDSLQQLLSLCALALALSLLTIRWAVRRGMGVLDELLRALQQVCAGQLNVRLRSAGSPEARQLALHFNRMTDALEQARTDNTRLTQTLLAVQEQERNHLAQTLHDDLGQYLAGIRAQACLLRLVADQPTVAGAHRWRNWKITAITCSKAFAHWSTTCTRWPCSTCRWPRRSRCW